MGIQYEHNSSYNRCDYYVAQTREKDSKKAHGVSLDNTFFAYGIPFGIKQPLQSDVIVVQNHYKNHCRISTGGQCGFFNDE